MASYSWICPGYIPCLFETQEAAKAALLWWQRATEEEEKEMAEMIWGKDQKMVTFPLSDKDAVRLIEAYASLPA